MSDKLETGVIKTHASFRVSMLFASVALSAYNALILFNSSVSGLNRSADQTLIIILLITWVSIGTIVSLIPYSKTKIPAVLVTYYILAGCQLLLTPEAVLIMQVYWTTLTVITFAVTGKKWAYVGLMFYGLVASLNFVVLGADRFLSDSGMVLSPITVVLGSLLIIEILSAKNTSYERVIIGQKRTKLDNDRITALVNNLRDAVISTDKDGGINLYNSAVLNILDTNTPITQKNIGDVFDIESVNGDKLNLLDELKRSTSTNYRDDIVMSVDKGDNIRLGITTVPIQSGYSLEPTGYLAIISDITKSKSLEEERDEFISVISHELRTPITIAEGALSNALIFSERNLFGKMDSAIGLAHKQIIFLAGLVNNLSSLSRAERGLIKDTEDIDIAKLVSQLQTEYEPQASEKGLVFTTNIDPNLKSIHSNPLYLKELLQNLITNAIKYTKTGTITVRASSLNDKKVIISVADTGIGISRGDQKKVFDRFYRVEDYQTRETNGTGLGLHVVSKLAESLGGEIKLESRINQGSTFSLILGK